MVKKVTAIGLIAVLGMALMAGCGKAEEETPVVSSEPEVIAEIVELEEEPDLHEGMARSPLTGEWIDEELAQQRPLAVMTGNTTEALPQYGIGSADVIYEAPVEASITRLMPIYQDYQDVEKFMSIRSCRLYYIDWALEFDAIYMHYGQAYLAEDMLSNDYVNNLSGLDGSLNFMFFRDSSRSAPHNAYATGESVVEGIASKGYDTQLSTEYTGHYVFNEDDEEEIQLDGEDAIRVDPGYSFNEPWFEYDPETGLYNRFQFGIAQVDGLTDEQLAVKNILFQEVDWAMADDTTGYLSVTTIGSGNGYYVTNGKVIPVTWSREGRAAPAR